jgi:hypothetical protein
VLLVGLCRTGWWCWLSKLGDVKFHFRRVLQSAMEKYRGFSTVRGCVKCVSKVFR